MNNYILISRTFSEWTPESSEDGDFSDKGFIDECEQVSFKELVALMKQHPHASQSPVSLKGDTTNVWYTSEAYTKDYYKGIEREECIHFHQDNTPNAAKYWRLAKSVAFEQEQKYFKNLNSQPK